MAAPVFNPNTSVLDGSIGKPFFYQPGFTDAQPAGAFTVDTLPNGITIDATTGLISGMPTDAVVWNTVIGFTNANGSASLPITIGIDDPGYISDVGIEVNVDAISGAVSFPTSPDGALHGKSGDTLLFLVGLTKNGELLDLPVTGIAFGLKEFTGDGLIILSQGGFTKVGVFNKTRWRMMAVMDAAKLASPLSNWEGKGAIKSAQSGDTSKVVSTLKIAQFQAPCEFRFTLQQLDANLQGTDILRRSQAFPMILEGSLT